MYYLLPIDLPLPHFKSITATEILVQLESMQEARILDFVARPVLAKKFFFKLRVEGALLPALLNSSQQQVIIAG